MKIGDKVRCINASGQPQLVHNKIYEIVNIKFRERNGLVLKGKLDSLFWAERFELVDPSIKQYRKFLVDESYFTDFIYERIDEIEGITDETPSTEIYRMGHDEIEIKFIVYDTCQCAACGNDEIYYKTYKVEEIFNK